MTTLPDMPDARQRRTVALVGLAMAFTDIEKGLDDAFALAGGAGRLDLLPGLAKLKERLHKEYERAADDIALAEERVERALGECADGGAEEAPF